MRLRMVKFATAPVDGCVSFLQPGRVYDVDEPFAGVLVAAGAAVDPDTPVAETVPETPEATEDTPAPESEGKSAAEEGPKRPPKTAKLELWQAYARSQGVDPGSMSRSEIIAALS